MKRIKIGEIEAMTDREVAAELDSLARRFSDADFQRLEGALYLRAAVLGWTGEPLKQPPRAVLASARSVLADKTSAERPDS